MAPSPGGARRPQGRWGKRERRNARKLRMTRDEWDVFGEQCRTTCELVRGIGFETKKATVQEPQKVAETRNGMRKSRTKGSERAWQKLVYEAARRMLEKRLPRVER